MPVRVILTGETTTSPYTDLRRGLTSLHSKERDTRGVIDMANYEDYLPGGKNDPRAPADGIDAEIKSAEADEAARQEQARDPATGQFVPNSTPPNWEDRFKNLEVHNSQQAQTLGDYRKIIDDFITNPTPAVNQPPQQESKPLTSDDLWEHPDESIDNKINIALANHPAIKDAEKIKETFATNERNRSVSEFKDRHPDFEDIKATPEFASWVSENNTRVALAQQADGYDMNSADALFSLYKAEKGLAQVTSSQQETDAIQAATLEESSNVMVAPEQKYSRGEFIETKIRAEQGDQEAVRWINRNIAAYREALGSGSVRD